MGPSIYFYKMVMVHGLIGEVGGLGLRAFKDLYKGFGRFRGKEDPEPSAACRSIALVAGPRVALSSEVELDGDGGTSRRLWACERAWYLALASDSFLRRNVLRIAYSRRRAEERGSTR